MNRTHFIAILMTDFQMYSLNSDQMLFRNKKASIKTFKTQETIKNILRYYTFNCLIRDLLSNMFPFQNYEILVTHTQGDLRRVQIL